MKQWYVLYVLLCSYQMIDVVIKVLSIKVCIISMGLTYYNAFLTYHGYFVQITDKRPSTVSWLSEQHMHWVSFVNKILITVMPHEQHRITEHQPRGKHSSISWNFIIMQVFHNTNMSGSLRKLPQGWTSARHIVIYLGHHLGYVPVLRHKKSLMTYSYNW